MLDRLSTMRMSDKGILFLVRIDDCKEIKEKKGDEVYEVYLQMIAKSLHADIRVVDVLGLISEDIVAIFISGRISIDIIERRAQRIMDLFFTSRTKGFSSSNIEYGDLYHWIYNRSIGEANAGARDACYGYSKGTMVLIDIGCLMICEEKKDCYKIDDVIPVK